MRFRGLSYSSSVKTRTLTPKWEKETFFDLGPLDANGMDQLTIKLIDRDHLTPDDPMGSLSVSERTLWVAAEENYNSWFNVNAPDSEDGERHAGQIQLEVEWLI